MYTSEVYFRKTAFALQYANAVSEIVRDFHIGLNTLINEGEAIMADSFIWIMQKNLLTYSPAWHWVVERVCRFICVLYRDKYPEDLDSWELELLLVVYVVNGSCDILHAN